jgi:hypothetical protein
MLYWVYMERTESTGTPGEGAERRTCANCNETKPVVPGAWAFKPGGDPLQICLVCQTMRRAESRAAKKQDSSDKPKTPKAIREDAKLDVAKAFRTGAAIANEYVDLVMARVLQYASDPKHHLHAWALQFLAERIMPRKLYEELGGQAAGVGGLNDKRPVFNIQILPAQPSEPAGRVIEGQVQTVEVLPAPKE